MSLPIRITEFVVFCLPFLKILVVLGILVPTTVYLFRARSMRRWLRVCMRVGGGILVLPLVPCTLLLVAMAACTSRPRIIVSPDSNHITEYSYQAGFLGSGFHVCKRTRKMEPASGQCLLVCRAERLVNYRSPLARQ